MNFMWILLYVCLIEQTAIGILGNEHHLLQEKEDRSISAAWNKTPLKLANIDISSRNKPKKDHSSAIKLVDLGQEKGINSVQDNFGVKLISAIQKIITNLLSNPQTIFSISILIPTFPPAAIIGSFVMVISSILQNPTLWQFFQNILPDVNSFADGSNKNMVIPKHLKDFTDIGTEPLNAVKKGAKYGTKLVDIASIGIDLDDLNADELDSPNHQESRKMKTPSSFTKIDKIHRNGKYQKKKDGSQIPLSELE